MSLPICSLAQEQNDTIFIQGNPTLSPSDILELNTPISQPILSPDDAQNWTNTQPDIELKPALDFSAPAFNQAPRIHYELFPRGSNLPSWSTGYMYGSHAYSGSLLYGYTANAQAGILQHLGDYWTVDASVNFNKYSVYYNTVTFGGSVMWHPSKFFSLTAFGAYTPGSFLSPISIGPAFQWGGYATFQTDTDLPFGIDVGARDYYDPLSGHYVTPIVQPFVKIGGAKLGIDFGPALRNALDRSKSHPRGPGMIPQPIKAIPQVAPRN